MNIWEELNYFTVSEFTNPDKMNPKLLHKLDDVRHVAGLTIFITSSFRVGDAGAHGDGDAVDIADNKTGEEISSRWRHKILAAAYAAGFKRIGSYDKHLHLDVSLTRIQEVSWIGKSS